MQVTPLITNAWSYGKPALWNVNQNWYNWLMRPCPYQLYSVMVPIRQLVYITSWLRTVWCNRGKCGGCQACGTTWMHFSALCYETRLAHVVTRRSSYNRPTPKETLRNISRDQWSLQKQHTLADGVAVDQSRRADGRSGTLKKWVSR